ncbi:hypothetical protein GBA52_015683 [Prunus armeniaca]|nr:hypothetical protein GBA52_015683 [Prunus armeniaca]
MRPQTDKLSVLDLQNPLSRSLDSSANPLSGYVKLEGDEEQQLALEIPGIENAQGSAELKDVPVVDYIMVLRNDIFHVRVNFFFTAIESSW